METYRSAPIFDTQPLILPLITHGLPSLDETNRLCGIIWRSVRDRIIFTPSNQMEPRSY